MISDEKLAAYIDGTLSSLEKRKIEESMDVDTMEVINVSKAALSDASKLRNRLPRWSDIKNALLQTDAENQLSSLAMAGFLGEKEEEEEAEHEDEK